MLVILKRIEGINVQQNFFIRHLKKTVGLGLLLSLSIPAQGLGTTTFKGPSILAFMELSYWELALIIAIFYTFGCFIGHFVWKLQDDRYLKELHEEKEQLMRELGIQHESII